MNADCTEFWVYLLRCADDTLYCGIAADTHRRLHEHNHTGRGAKYTRPRRPVAIVHREGPFDRSGALRREREIKSMTRAQKLSLIATTH